MSLQSLNNKKLCFNLIERNDVEAYRKQPRTKAGWYIKLQGAVMYEYMVTIYVFRSTKDIISYKKLRKRANHCPS